MHSDIPAPAPNVRQLQNVHEHRVPVRNQPQSHRPTEKPDRSDSLLVGQVVESVLEQLGLGHSLLGEHSGELLLVRVGLLVRHDGHVLEVGGETHGDALGLLLPVEVGEVESHGDDEQAEDRPAADVDVETGVVVRRLLGEVDLGSDDLTRYQRLVLAR